MISAYAVFFARIEQQDMKDETSLKHIKFLIDIDARKSDGCSEENRV